jgi:hypothetical protein
MSGMPLILDEDAVRALLRMDELIPAMATALADLSRGKVAQPMRVMMPVGDHGGFLGGVVRGCLGEARHSQDHTRYGRGRVVGGPAVDVPEGWAG